MKKLPKTLEGQMAALFKEGLKSALPRSKTRGRRNGDDRPLTSWMAGAPDKYESKIEQVLNGCASYPYLQIGAGAKILSDRIANRYKVTWIQHSLIEDYVLSHYRGRSTNVTGWRNSEFIIELNPDNTSFRTRNALWGACEKAKTQPSQLPLRVLISDQFTNLLLLIELEERAKTKRMRYGR
jgi:hypothetical protein